MKSNQKKKATIRPDGVEWPQPLNDYQCRPRSNAPHRDDLLIVPVRQMDDRTLLKADLAPALFEAVTAQLNDRYFSAAEGEMRSVHVDGTHIELIGMGKDYPDRSMYRWVGSCAVQMARGRKARTVAVGRGSIPTEDWPAAAADIAQGAELGSFRFEHYKTNTQDRSEAGRLRFIFAVDSDMKAVERRIREEVLAAAAANFARHLANHPPNVIDPDSLVQICRQLARRAKLRCRIITYADAQKFGMGGLCGVGRGSPKKPAIIILEHAPAGSRAAPLAVVGKAVTFDTGGISIKPAADMGAMKYDKCGGMTAIGVAAAAAMMKLPQRIICAIPTAENMPDGDAYRPGDILRMHNGKTVDVTNTDAEGRLILADAISYLCREYKPVLLIDLATLTGGVVTALGGVYAGLMSNHDKLAAELAAAGERTDELLWRLPLHKRYRKLLDSPHADMVNSGGREAHPIQGGMFLQEFIPAEVPWAHLDIAGVAHPRKDFRYLKADQASGFGVRLIVDFIRWRLRKM